MSKKRLDQMRPNERAIIRHIGELGELKQRLLEMGVLCGEPVEVVRKAPFGGPIQIRVGQTDMALRRDEAARIEVESLSARASGKVVK
ncbi:FeoA family protein [Hydrogenimonas sp. SS33]|uniref:FeoA family protein n=1 Tax=Hydrogenimonas leucolamina TaxID=2954236 RepID=UPI00336BBDED